MIRKLQRKFILIAMCSLLLVMLFLIGLINIIYFYQMNVKIDSSIQVIAENQGKIPDLRRDPPKMDNPFLGFEMDPEAPYVTRYFVVEFNLDRSVKQIDTSHIKAISSEDALEYATEIMDNGNLGGYKGIYKFKIVKQLTGYMVIFMDCRNQIQNGITFLVISCGVAIVTSILMFILISILSKRAMKPFIENAEKQKLFITDAGHEIKTPLAIISANADVLELTGGTNEWINSIRNQTSRLDKLVKNLLTLSKLDEENVKLTFSEFDLSETVARIAGSFLAVAEANNKKYHIDVQPGIRLMGDESSMEQLISTLMDNAMKYSNKEGNILITLTGNKKGPRLEVSNTVDQLDETNLDKLFDRFYRTDASRSRETGGYGIGLSIAKSIVNAHHGRISVRCEDGKAIQFIVQL